MTLELENMTLPELKAALARYNLETTGKRADLVARLSNHFNQDSAGKSKESAKTVKASPKQAPKPSPKLVPKASTKSTGEPSTQTLTATATHSSQKSESKEPKSPSKSPLKSPAKSPVGSPSVTGDPKKELSAMTMEERLALRAKRFNLEPQVKRDNKKMKMVLVEDPEVLKKRSERFGIPFVTEQKVKSQKPPKKFEFVVDEEELERRKKRLERFST